jgi:hypothetical protein
MKIDIRPLVLSLALCVVLIGSLSMSARAAEHSLNEEPDSGWEVSLAPYAFLPGINGNTQALGAANSVKVSLSPWDFAEVLLDNLDFAFIGAAEARRDEFGVLFDVLHLQLSAGRVTPRGFLRANMDLTQTMATAMGTYRVAETDMGHLDLMAGARLWNVDLGLKLFPAIGPMVARNDGDTWIDPMVGVKGKHELGGPWSFSGWAMVGGGASDISWDIYGALNYDVRENFSLLAGYRAIGIDYQSGGFVFDLVMAGPLLGAVWRF